MLIKRGSAVVPVVLRILQAVLHMTSFFMFIFVIASIPNPPLMEDKLSNTEIMIWSIFEGVFLSTSHAVLFYLLARPRCPKIVNRLRAWINNKLPTLPAIYHMVVLIVLVWEALSLSRLPRVRPNQGHMQNWEMVLRLTHIPVLINATLYFIAPPYSLALIMKSPPKQSSSLVKQGATKLGAIPEEDNEMGGEDVDFPIEHSGGNSCEADSQPDDVVRQRVNMLSQ